MFRDQNHEEWLGKVFDRTSIKGTGFKLRKNLSRAFKAHISQSEEIVGAAKSISGKIEHFKAYNCKL